MQLCYQFRHSEVHKKSSLSFFITIDLPGGLVHCLSANIVLCHHCNAAYNSIFPSIFACPWDRGQSHVNWTIEFARLQSNLSHLQEKSRDPCSRGVGSSRHFVAIYLWTWNHDYTGFSILFNSVLEVLDLKYFKAMFWHLFQTTAMLDLSVNKLSLLQSTQSPGMPQC